MHVPSTLCIARWAAAFWLLSSLMGCAALDRVSSEVAVYNQWPQGRKPAAYVFDRLPSQQAQGTQQDRLEALAQPGLEAAGFVAAADPQAAQFTIQLGVRAHRADTSPYDDPFWWRTGLYHLRHGRRVYAPYDGPRLAFQVEHPRYEREVAVLIRDRVTNVPVYEARASTEGYTLGSDALIAAMFRAAMADFPYAGPSPRSVPVRLGRLQP